MLAPRMLKKIALVTVFIFAWINLTADYGHAQQGTDPLSQAQELYKSERYDAAVQLLQTFIAQNRGLAGQNGEVANAYYLLAKIYYELREDKKMGEVLESLFSLAPRYRQEESNEGFKKVVDKYRGNLVVTPSGSEPVGIVEKQVKDPGKTIIKKKRKFPILLMVGGIVVVGLLVYLLLKKPKYTLTVNKGSGVSGIPDSGAYEYKKGTTVNYDYSLQSGYKNLLVMLDGQTIGSSGTITMDANHGLTVTAEQKASYSLNVLKGTGVAGTPEAGIFWWQEGQTASWNYSLQSGYINLSVMLDDVAVAASGTVTMDKNHTLSAATTETFVLTVIRDDGANGTPSSGTYTCPANTTVNYSYTYKIGVQYREVKVRIDGAGAPLSGSIVMNGNHTLTADGTTSTICVLVVGSTFAMRIANPSSGTYYFSNGSLVAFNYCANPYLGVEVLVNWVSVCKSFPTEVGSCCSGSFNINGNSEIGLIH